MSESAAQNMMPVDAWSAVAAAWDADADYVNEHSVESTRAMIDRLAVKPGERVLELAAGPGSLGGTWSALVGANGSVVVSDLSPAMVEAARRRNAAFANVETAVVDLTSIDQPDGSFDAVACRMGLMFAPEPATGFAEIHRVLRAGGRFAGQTWAGMEHNPWMTCVGMAAMLNGVVSGGPPIGPGGIFSLGDPAKLEQLAKDAGFADVNVDEHPVAFRADSFDAHFDHVTALAGPLATALKNASPDQLAAVRRTAAEIAAPYVTGDGVSIPGKALVVSGRR